jgi:hypothetical protein
LIFYGVTGVEASNHIRRCLIFVTTRFFSLS